MRGRARQEISCSYNGNINGQLLAAGNALVSPGGGGIAPEIDCRSFPYCRLFLYADQIIRLDIEMSPDNTAWYVAEVLAMPAANVHTDVYDLMAPRGQTGIYVIGAPWVRFRLTNTGAVATLNLRFHATLATEY